MLMPLRDFLCGWYTAEVKPEEKGAAFDLLYRNALPFSGETLLPDGSVRFRIRKKAGERFRTLAEEAAQSPTFSPIHGLPVVCSFCLRRPAIVLGFLLGALWLFYSSRIVWEIKITGNSKTSDEEIIEQLGELGFGVGTRFREVDFNKLHARYAAVQHDIAWLSIYMDGTVADVQVQELWRDERYRPPENTYANVVASEAGVVDVVHVYEGKAAVKPGETVRPGQVLISGVVEKKDGGIRYEYAAGEVFCTTAAPISVKVSVEQEEKRYTGREKAVFRVKFFEKSINLFGNGGIEYATYDTIDKMEQICPLGLRSVPVWIGKTVYREYSPETETLSPEAAAEKAMSELSEKIREATAGAELIEKNVDSYFRDGIYCIDCLLYLRRDIGTTVEFTAEEAVSP